MIMKETIEEILRMYNVTPEEDLILSLETFVKHEIINAKHELMVQVSDMIEEVTGVKNNENTR